MQHLEPSLVSPSITDLHPPQGHPSPECCTAQSQPTAHHETFVGVRTQKPFGGRRIGLGLPELTSRAQVRLRL